MQGTQAMIDLTLHSPKIMAISKIGETLDTYLKERPCPSFCPTETQEAINKIVEESYLLGYQDAVKNMQDHIFFDMQTNINKAKEKP